MTAVSPYCHPAPCASNPAGVESSAVDPPLPFDPARSSHCVCDSHRALGVRGRQPRCDQEGDGGAGGTARVHHGGDGTGIEDWPTDQPASLVSRLTASCPLPCSRPACSTHIFSFLLLLRCRSFLTVFGRLVDDVCTASTFRRTLRHGRSRTSTCSVPPCLLLLSPTWARGAGRFTSPSYRLASRGSITSRRRPTRAVRMSPWLRHWMSSRCSRSYRALLRSLLPRWFECLSPEHTTD